MQSDIINYCQTILGDVQSVLLETLIDLAISDFLDYCNLEEVPERATGLICSMVLVLYNRKEAYGIASQSFSGVSETFIDGYPANIVKQLNRYRKMRII